MWNKQAKQQNNERKNRKAGRDSNRSDFCKQRVQFWGGGGTLGWGEAKAKAKHQQEGSTNYWNNKKSDMVKFLNFYNSKKLFIRNSAACKYIQCM